MLLALATALMLSTPQDPAASTTPHWSDRGVFVFGEGIVLDFQQGQELAPDAQMPPQRERLVDCSTDEFYCARGETIRIVLPRDCDRWADQSEFTAGGVRTVVLHRDGPERGDFHNAGPRLLLGDPDDPRIVYDYRYEAGVRVIWLGWFPERDLATEAREDRFGDVEALQSPPPVQASRFPLQTFDLFGPCRWTASRPWTREAG